MSHRALGDSRGAHKATRLHHTRASTLIWALPSFPSAPLLWTLAGLVRVFHIGGRAVLSGAGAPLEGDERAGHSALSRGQVRGGRPVRSRVTPNCRGHVRVRAPNVEPPLMQSFSRRLNCYRPTSTKPPQ
jgi:hypothetical protein